MSAIHAKSAGLDSAICCKNSARAEGHVLNSPSISDVVVTDCCFSTPRIIMHM